MNGSAPEAQPARVALTRFDDDVRFVFWTGGLDSTFRILDLVERGQDDVQPIYVIDPMRRSWALELKTMRDLRAAMRARFAGAQRLAPTLILHRDDFPVDADLTEAFAALEAQWHIGTQYAWLAQIARDIGAPDRSIELCMPRHPEPSALQRNIFVDPESADSPLTAGPPQTLFGAYLFPTLSTTKADMARIARERGFGDLLDQTWFCHKPIGDLPCGRCAPCVIARAERPDVIFAPPPPAPSLIRRAARRIRRALHAGRDAASPVQARRTAEARE
jgi:hypothetical protein